MRLFIAAELPGEAVEALAETSAALRASVRGRYVGPDSYHVTLAFLGEVEGTRVDAACTALERACADYRAFDVSFGELGCFGRRSKATLWQGFSDAGSLPDLASSVRAELSAAGFSFDDKAFRAHITLMRAADVTRGELPAPAFGTFRISHVSLFKSDLTGKRPVYEPLCTMVL